MIFSRDLPVLGEYDTVVVGGGPAGLCAAVSAAREGARVALAERFGALGGNLTAGHVRLMLGNVHPNTMAQELYGLLNKEPGKCHDVEEARLLLDKWVQHDNLTVYLLCPVVDVLLSGNQIIGLAVSTPEGLRALLGKTVIDATGDGTVAYLCGAPYAYGRDGDGLVQPASIMFTVGNIDPNQKIVCCHEEDDTVLPNGDRYLALCRRACASGELPPNVNIVRLYATTHGDERLVNATQENGVNGLDTVTAFSTEAALRRQEQQVWQFLVRNVPGFAHSRITSGAELVGFRETRRILGETVIRAEDLIRGAVYPDAVVYGAFS